MTTTVALFIGSSDVARIESIVANLIPGFTVIPATGYWHGVREDSTILIASADREDISTAIKSLKSELCQESIAVESLPDMRFI